MDGGVVHADVLPQAERPSAQPQVVAASRGVATGTIAFQSDVQGRPKIFTLDLATGQVRQLTTGADWRDEAPRWSPDGAWIAFGSNRAHYASAGRSPAATPPNSVGRSPAATPPNSAGRSPAATARADLDIWVMRADGTGARRITSDPGNDETPSWTPDGRAIVFSSDRASRGDLYRVRVADGHTERLTTNFVGRAIMPAVSPDGATVAFAAQTLRVGAFWNFQVHLLDVVTGRTRPLPASGGACWPAWTPDGRALYNVQLEREPSALQRRTIATGDVQTVHAHPTLWSYYPRSSPDGRWVALSVSPQHHEGEDWDLALVDAGNPSRLVRLTSGPGNDRLPDWRPR